MIQSLIVERDAALFVLNDSMIQYKKDAEDSQCQNIDTEENIDYLILEIFYKILNIIKSVN